MRYAVYTSSVNGLVLARKIRDTVDADVDIYVHHKLGSSNGVYIYSRIAEAVEKGFSQYTAMIFIMAAGIVVRTIAPFLKSKLSDPAIIVMDEKGKNIISLLSGHLGGANELTSYLAKELKANPVITTGTDVNELVAPDLLAYRLEMVPFPKEGILVFNSALLGGSHIKYIIDSRMPCHIKYAEGLKKSGIGAVLAGGDKISQLVRDTQSLKVILTNADLPIGKGTLYLKPRKLVAGVGCRRGTKEGLIIKALKAACEKIGWELERIDELASSVVKADEQGLLTAGQQLGRTIKFWDNEQLNEQIQKYQLMESDFVKRTIGVGNISEAAAYCCVPHGVAALPKTKYERVTVALVWEK